MPQIDTITDASLFRTVKTESQPSKVDRKANIIFGASLMQAGDLNDGDSRPWTVDSKTLDQASKLANKSRNGLKARFTHPNMSADGMGSYLGRWKNVRVDGDTLRGDLHIADAAFTSPQGDLGTYVMDLAESDPEAFGVSLATRLDSEDMRKHERQSDGGPESPRWPMRFSDIRAGDVVDEPAATRGGLFDMSTPDLRNLPAQATALLSTYFGDAEPDVVRARINSFLDRYFANKEPDMAEATEPATTAVTEPTAPAAPPAAELSAAAPTADVATTTTTDFAAIERDRCKKIRALVDLAGVPEKFNLFVDNNFSVEETQAALRDIVAKKNPALASSPEPQIADPDAGLKAEYAEAVKFNVHMGLTEAEYVAAHAKRRKS